MKYKIEFSAHEKEDAERAFKAQELKSVIDKMDMYLRDLLKYGYLEESVRKALEDASSKLHEYIDMYEVRDLFG